jgi:hypothetical protein
MSAILIQTLTDLQAMSDNRAGQYVLANDIDVSASAGWNPLIDRGTWAGGTAYNPNDRVTHGGSAYFAHRANTDVEPGVTSGWADWWQTTTLPVGAPLGWLPVGKSSDAFTGTFDGQGYTIGSAENPLYMHRPIISSISSVVGYGLFGAASGLACWVKRVRLHVNFVGGYLTGPVVGDVRNGSVVEECAVDGTISAVADLTGGLVGITQELTDQTASIRNCRTSVAVTGSSSTALRGGLIGTVWSRAGEVLNCLSTGAVLPTGGSNGGGLVGRVVVAGMADTANFWDTQTSGWATSAMGTGKTTAEMRTLATFADAGWDIVPYADHDGEQATATWFIKEGEDYPRLWFEWTRPSHGHFVSHAIFGLATTFGLHRFGSPGHGIQ